MKKIIPFKKQLTFKTNVSEITSISLENTLHNNQGIIEGDLIVSGAYKITETSLKTDEFEFKIPISIEIDDKYEKENIIIDINDFFYEIINNIILEVNVEVMLDNIIEKVIEPLKNELLKEEKIIKLENDDRCIEEEIKIEPIEETNVFNQLETFDEEYSMYYIYIIREGDTLEEVISKYNIEKEKLSEYNDITELKIGDKLIIPTI